MKTFKVIFSRWNGYSCGCCRETSYFNEIYKADSYEKFLSILKKDIKKYYWINKTNDDIVDFYKFYKITNNGNTQTIMDSSSLLKKLEDVQKEVDITYEKYKKRKEKEKIRIAIKATEKKIRENALQKELEDLQSKLKEL